VKSVIVPPSTLPFRFLLMTLAAWTNRSQQDVIEYLQEVNRDLREHFGGKRLHFTEEEAVANLKEATALYLSEFPLPTTGHPVITMFTVPESASA
jgi:hypothetical protein